MYCLTSGWGVGSRRGSQRRNRNQNTRWNSCPWFGINCHSWKGDDRNFDFQLIYLHSCTVTPIDCSNWVAFMPVLTCITWEWPVFDFSLQLYCRSIHWGYENRQNDPQPKELWLLNKFSLSALKETCKKSMENIDTYVGV